MGSSKTENINQPPAFIQHFQGQLLNDAFKGFQNIDNGSFRQLTGINPVAAINPAQTQGLQNAIQAAQGTRGAGLPLFNLGQAQARGDFLDPNNNPALLNTVRNAVAPIQDQLLGQILPQIGSASSQQGAFGGSRQALLEGQAIGSAQEAAGRVAGDILFQNLQSERQLQQNSGNLISQAVDLLTGVPERQAQLGTQLQALQQANLDRLQQQFEVDQGSQIRRANLLGDLVAQQAGTAGGSSTTKGPDQTAAAVTGGLGSLALLALAFGSHSGLKRVHEEPSDILEKIKATKIYRWDYELDKQHTPHMGPMAEELQKTFNLGDGVNIQALDILGILFAGIRELTARLERLETTV